MPIIDCGTNKHIDESDLLQHDQINCRDSECYSHNCNFSLSVCHVEMEV